MLWEISQIPEISPLIEISLLKNIEPKKSYFRESFIHGSPYTDLPYAHKCTYVHIMLALTHESENNLAQ